ncbi:MAG: hypothetical protein IPO21_17755 [Bacteroidales bacterium]|nr:hypothetical protein [Bacteroidales bacterium]
MIPFIKHQISKSILNSRYYILFFTFLPILLLSNPSLLDKKLIISFKNEKISSVIAKLESIGNVSFIYETGIIDMQKTITTAYNNEALGTIIKETILNEDIQIYVIGNKILLYKKNNPPQGITGKVYTIPLKTESNNNKERYKITTITVYDSVTIKCFDTIKIVTHDTLKVYDTVKIANKLVLFFKKNIKFSLLGYGYMQFNNETVKFNGNNKLSDELIKSESEKKNNFIGGLGIKLSHKKLGLEIGVKMDRQKWAAEYDFTKIVADSSNIIAFDEEYEWVYTKIIIPGGGQTDKAE